MPGSAWTPRSVPDASEAALGAGPVRSGVGSWAAALVLVVLVWLASAMPLVGSGARLGIWDWDHHFASAELERQAVLEHGRVPLWNPYLRGGLPVLQHPLGSIYCPDFWIVLALGVPLGFKWLLAFRLLVGLAGGLLLGRTAGLSPPAAALVAILSGASGAWAAHVTLGHAEWSLLAYVPWILVALLRGMDGLRAGPTLLAAAGIALLYLGGNVYLLTGLALFWGAYASVESLQRRRATPLVSALAAFALAGALAGAKLLPSAELFAEHPRVLGGFKRLASHEPDRGLAELPRAFHTMFLARDVAWPEDPRLLMHRPLRDYTARAIAPRLPLVDFVNFSAYLGALPLLFLPFAFLARSPLAPGLAAGSGLLLLLVFSDPLQRAVGLDPWAALQRLPVFATLRTPGRFLAIAVVGLALLCGIGLQEALRRLPARALRLAPGLALAVLAWVALDQATRNARLLARAFPWTAPAVERAERFETQRLPLAGFDFLSVVARTGAYAAHDNLELEVSVLPVGAPGYRGEAFLLDAGGGEVGSAELRSVSPNAIEVAVRVDAPARLVVNQTHLEAWRRADRPAPVRSHAGRVETDVGPEDALVRLEYRPRSLRAGQWLSLAALAGGLVWLGRERRMPRRDSA